MFSGILLLIALVAMAQFALYYWRAVFTGIASLPLSARVLEAVAVEETDISGDDFEKLASLHALTPELKNGTSGLWAVRLYYDFVRRVENLLGDASPLLMNWAERERTLCARFAAVQIDRRLQGNLLEAASMRSL